MSFFEKLKGSMGVTEVKPALKEKKKAKKDKKIPQQIKTAEPPAEGQLAIDVFETPDEFIIQSTIAGIKADDLDIDIENDLVTVRGSRKKSSETAGQNYIYQECYWGSFSRQVILPEEVDGSKAEAAMKDGILTLKIPKIHKKEKKKIAVRQEE